MIENTRISVVKIQRRGARNDCGYDITEGEEIGIVKVVGSPLFISLMTWIVIADILWNEVSFPILILFLISFNAFVNVELSLLHNILYLYFTSLMTLFACTII